MVRLSDFLNEKSSNPRKKKKKVKMSILIGEETMDGIAEFHSGAEYRGLPLDGYTSLPPAGDSLHALSGSGTFSGLRNSSSDMPLSPIRLSEETLHGGSSGGSSRRRYGSPNSFNLFSTRDHYPIGGESDTELDMMARQQQQHEDSLGAAEDEDEDEDASNSSPPTSRNNNSSSSSSSSSSGGGGGGGGGGGSSSTKKKKKKSKKRKKASGTTNGAVANDSVESSALSSSSRSKTSPDHGSSSVARGTPQPKVKRKRKEREDWTTDDQTGFYKALRKNNVQYSRDK